jgi:hypothetical protein
VGGRKDFANGHNRQIHKLSDPRSKAMTPLPFVALALVGASLFSQSASAACYVVYGPDKDVVYRSMEPPVDMARQIHETLPLVAPHSSLVFSPYNDGCELTVNKLPLVTAQRSDAGGAMVPGTSVRARRGARS